jgi:hypothetical protein
MKTKSILEIIGSSLLVALLAIIIGSYSPGVRAAQYDVAYPIRISGTGALLLPYLGTTGTWNVLTVTSTNGFVQTTGSGLTVNPSPVISGTAAIAAVSGTNISAGTLGFSSSNTLVIYGTAGNWKNVP